jgi:hypothetical protein
VFTVLAKVAIAVELGYMSQRVEPEAALPTIGAR